jgi:hypothetical protein
MGGKRTVAVWSVIVTVVAIALAATFLIRIVKKHPSSISGAVIRQDSDTRKELPLADVQVTVGTGPAAARTSSDSSGFFSLRLPRGTKMGQPIVLRFRHADYQDLDLREVAGDKLYLADMVPLAREVRAPSQRPEVAVSNIVVRYSRRTTTDMNIGSAVKTFEVVNRGNILCNGQRPCSPDGKWKAAIGSVSLDAGEGHEFRNARASCIAGPCPFTRIESDNFAAHSRTLTVSALNWSDPVTFLVEAEVFHPMVSDLVRESYPVIFGPALNFTLPITAEGVSIRAELNGSSILFPLGPALFLSWADCNARTNPDQTRVYRCELKPGYRFPQ